MTTELWGWVIFAGYCAIGLPVVWWHLEREAATEKDVPTKRDFKAVILLLAVIWPILLLAILASYIGNKLDKPSPRKK